MPEFTLLFVLSQLLAALAFTSGIIAFQQHQRSAMLKFWFVSALLNACHFAVLAQYQAALFVGLTLTFSVAACPCHDAAKRAEIEAKIKRRF